MVQPMISCEDLRRAMLEPNNSREEPFVVLDVSWDPSNRVDYCEEGYKICHIPGAFFFDFEHGTVPTEIYPNDIPDAATFEAYARTFGINSNTKVVVYESMGYWDHFIVAGRVWWLFRYFGHDNVCILDGGLDRWMYLNYPTTSCKTPLPDAGNFVARKRSEMLVTYEEVVENVNRKQPVAIVDSRLPCSLKNGKIQGSLNMPFNSFGDVEKMKLLERDVILTKIRSFGLDPIEQPVIVTCHSGMTACGLACIAASVGLPNWRVYIGSWTEWLKRQEQIKSQ